jgi:bacterioferritin-associated ferredoxin
MIVCVCKAINDRAIRRAVADGHDTFDALQFELGIGICCGKCVASACEVLCEARADLDGVDPQRTRTTQQPVHFVQRSPTREIALA